MKSIDHRNGSTMVLAMVANQWDSVSQQAKQVKCGIYSGFIGAFPGIIEGRSIAV